MSDALEAIARAKAIAARLAGSGAAASIDPIPAPAAATDVNAVADAALAALSASAAVGSKRKRWGADSVQAGVSDGSAAPATGSLIDEALAQAMNAKRTNVGGGGAGMGMAGSTSKKLMIPVEKYPGYNFIGLLIGPGGSKQRELVAQSGGNVKISIRGKGSSSSNMNPGMSEEPLHVLLEGQPESVDRAEKLIEPLLNDPEKAQAEKDRQLAVVSGSSSGGASSASTYTPKPVAQLIGLNGGGGGHYGPAAGAEAIEEKIGIPNGFVGYIIGKGGESITSMQRKSGCRVQIQKEHEMEAGSTQRIITLTGATPESVSMCRGIIEEMVQERARLNESRGGSFGGGPGNNAAGQAVQLQQALSEGQAHVTVMVPNNDVGLVIGKGGSTIRSIQERAGANVQIPQGPDHDNPAVRTVNITHPNLSGAEFAKTLIEEVLGSKNNNQGGGGYAAAPTSTDVTLQVQIPDQDVGMCIGKQGCVIREMQQRTKTRIQIPSQPTPGQIFRLATVSGPAEGCQKVQEIITRISAEQSSQFVMTGECFNNPYAQQQGYGQQVYGQQAQQYGVAAGQQGQDYSAQWAAYYAAQGGSAQVGNGTNAAGATSAVATATATTAAAPAAGAAGQKADAYYEDFFRYAYHYGEEAARKAYTSWAPPAGTPNPYGVNPNLGTGANATATASVAVPSPGVSSNAQSGQSSASNPNVKDSSVRSVSNLPAWMTKS